MSIIDTLKASLGRLILFIPNLIAAIIILAVGLLIAWGVGYALQRLARAVGLDRFMARHEVIASAESGRASRFLGRAVYWVIALVTFVAAADTLQLGWISTGLARVIAYLPNVLAAGLVVLAGVVFGRLAYRAIVRREEPTSKLWAQIARGSIYAVAGFMAIQELNIAVSIVTMAFALTLGAMAVAGAVAFGVGNRELAARITRDWYERNRLTPRPPESKRIEEHPEEEEPLPH